MVGGDTGGGLDGIGRGEAEEAGLRWGSGCTVGRSGVAPTGRSVGAGRGGGGVAGAGGRCAGGVSADAGRAGAEAGSDGAGSVGSFSG